MSLSLISYLLDLTWEINWWTVVWWGGMLVALFHIPSVLLRRETRPMAALAWVLCLIALPVLGVILWWMIGRTRLERRKRRWARSKKVVTDSLADVRQAIELPDDSAHTRINDGGSHFASDDALYLRQEEGVFPPTEGNRVEIFSSGQDAFNAFERAIREATDHVHFQFYIWQRDDMGRRFRDLLTEKAKEGVEVRVLYDAVGGAPVKRGFMDPLIEAGAKVESFLPVVLFERQLRVNFRNHRKIIVVDGKTGFTGGVNIGDEYCDWVDLAFRLDGPVVLQLQEVFAEDWYFATGEDLASTRYFVGTEAVQKALEETSEREDDADDIEQGRVAESVTARIIASGPDNPESAIQNVFFMAITGASRRIYITTPYFVPDQAMLMAIKTAAMRGVDVRLLTPGTSDIPIAQAAGRSYYAELLAAGVRIYEYHEERVLHAKSVVVDDVWSIIGSANMDIRSFLLNFEANAVLRDRELNSTLAEQFETHLERSTEMRLEDFEKRPLKHRLVESTARLFSPLL
jgi:cardiolipin synthase